MLLYAKTITPRLRYIAEFAGPLLSRDKLTLTSDLEVYRHSDTSRINYSDARILEKELFIRPAALLFEDNIQAQEINCFTYGEHPAFFATDGDLPFDVFAASFYLLSRYEEYLPHAKDMYGRFAHENSLAFRSGFLHVPLVNIWMRKFAQHLTSVFPEVPPPDTHFQYLPTYDIDIAWSYRNKGFWRNAAGFLQSMAQFRWREVRDRIAVLRHKTEDPFDAYAWMDRLHEQYHLKPYYFFLIPERRGTYDKNISPRHPAMRALIQQHFYRYPVGIHPSWISGDKPDLLKREIEVLKNITGKDVQASRQHYIRFTLPVTYRRLLDAGIRFDFSMGYGSINGFRASVASPHYWYDLKAEQQTSLLLFPFCYMEANSYYEQKFTPQKAAEEMDSYLRVVQSVDGMLITIWHNSFLGTDPEFADWKEAYQEFVRKIPVTRSF